MISLKEVVPISGKLSLTRFPGQFDRVGKRPTCEVPWESNAGFIVTS